MTFEPYFELQTRHGKLNTILMVGIKRIETDNFGAPQDSGGLFFPRIFIHYINDKVLKLDFEDEAVYDAQMAYESIKRISEQNMQYIIENKMLDQFFKV